MNYWIFQSVVDRYDLRDDEIVGIGKSDTWYATRYKSKMKKGDRVYFWLGGLGSDRGIYAAGMLNSDCYQKPEWKSSGIDVIYTAKLDKPIVIDEIVGNPLLKDLLILKAAQATNFLIEKDQAEEIERLIKVRGE